MWPFSQNKGTYFLLFLKKIIQIMLCTNIISNKNPFFPKGISFISTNEFIRLRQQNVNRTEEDNQKSPQLIISLHSQTYIGTKCNLQRSFFWIRIVWWFLNLLRLVNNHKKKFMNALHVRMSVFCTKTIQLTFSGQFNNFNPDQIHSYWHETLRFAWHIVLFKG